MTRFRYPPGCKGLMREDVTRTRDGTKDRTGGLGSCSCDGVQWADMRGSPHRKGAKGCVHHDEIVLERSLKPTPKHSPRKNPYEPEGDPPF